MLASKKKKKKVRQSHAALSGKVNSNAIEQINTLKQSSLEEKVLSICKKRTHCCKRSKMQQKIKNYTGSTFCLGVDVFIKCAQAQPGLPKLFLVAFNLVKFPFESLTFDIYSSKSDRNSVSDFFFKTPNDILFFSRYFISLLARILFYVKKRSVLSLLGKDVSILFVASHSMLFIGGYKLVLLSMEWNKRNTFSA